MVSIWTKGQRLYGSSSFSDFAWTGCIRSRGHGVDGRKKCSIARKTSESFLVDLVDLVFGLPTLKNDLDGIPEIRISLQDFLSPIGFAILPTEVYRVRRDDDNDQNVASQNAVDSRSVGRTILRAEDKRARDASNTTETNHCCRTKGALPVATKNVSETSNLGATRY